MAQDDNSLQIAALIADHSAARASWMNPFLSNNPDPSGTVHISAISLSILDPSLHAPGMVPASDNAKSDSLFNASSVHPQLRSRPASFGLLAFSITAIAS
jgi:hypothetical protein